MGEIGEAVQVISISIQGMEFAFKVGKSLSKDFFKLLRVLLKALTVASTNVHNVATKEWGSIPFTTLMKEDRNIRPFQCLEKDFETVCKNLKKYNIPYSVLPDINKEDNFREIVIHEKSIDRLNLMLEKMGIDVNEIDFSDYAKNTDSQGMDDLENQYQKAKEEGEIKPEDEVKKNDVEHNFNNDELLKVLAFACAAIKVYDGSISLHELLEEDRNIKPFQCSEKDLADVCKNLKKNNIPYSILPDMNKEDDFREIVIHEKNIAGLSEILEKSGLNVNKINFEDYVKSADPEGKKYLEEQYQKAKEAGVIKPEPEVKMGMKNDVEHKFNSNEELKNDLRYKELRNNKNNLEITINKKSLDCVETDYEMISRIPGKKDQYVVIPKVETFRTDPTGDGGFKTYLAFLNPEKMYNIYDKENKPVGIVKGSDLKERYANVNREHFKKPQQKKPTKSK